MTHLRAVLFIAIVAVVVGVGATGTRHQGQVAHLTSLPGTGVPSGGELFGRLDTTLRLSFGRDDIVAAPATISGNASYAVPALGPNYLAMELPHGTLVTITGPGGSWTARVNDYGPSRYIRPRRVADIALVRWLKICGVTTTRIGLCFVSVSRAGVSVASRPNPTPPQTDTAP